jgi:hypothetical protein
MGAKSMARPSGSEERCGSRGGGVASYVGTYEDPTGKTHSFERSKKSVLKEVIMLVMQHGPIK